MAKKPHPLKGKKKSAASIAKRLATMKAKKEAIARGEMMPEPRVKKPRKNAKRVEHRTFDQLVRDVGEAIWCLNQAVVGTRKGIAAGLISLTDVSDEEVYMYMAKRYLEGGLKV